MEVERNYVRTLADNYYAVRMAYHGKDENAQRYYDRLIGER